MQNTIRVLANHWFTILPVWIFIICGNLTVLYFQKVERHLNNLIVNSRKISNLVDTNLVALEILKSLQWIKQLNLSINYLHKRFSTMLIAFCFVSAITILASSFYIIHYSRKKCIVVLFWDTSNFILFFICLSLMSYNSDRMQHAVKGFKI